MGNHQRHCNAHPRRAAALSYTNLCYDPIKVNPARIAPDGSALVTVNVTVNVTNTGKRAGDEVVQLYPHDRVASVTRPVKELRGFSRIHLKAGESKRVEVKLGSADLGLWDRDMKGVVDPGKFDVMVGASSADIRQRGTLEVAPAYVKSVSITWKVSGMSHPYIGQVG